MRKTYPFCLLLAACGGDVGTTEPGTGTSTGEQSTGPTPTTDEPEPTTSGGIMTTDVMTATDATTVGTTGDVTTSDGTTAGTTTDGTTGPACLEHSIADPEEYPVELVLGCQLEELCPGEGPMTFQPEGDEWTTNDIDRGRCLVTAMRDRTIGTLRYQEGEEGNLDAYTIEIHGEQVSLRHIRAGLGFDYAYEERVTFLREPEFFACVTGDANAVHACLEDGFLDECATELECPR